jgi:hypothetical protein
MKEEIRKAKEGEGKESRQQKEGRKARGKEKQTEKGRQE